MIKYDIEHLDLDGNPAKETAMFHLMEPDLMELMAEIGVVNTEETTINEEESRQKMISMISSDAKSLLAFFKAVVSKTYGVRVGQSFLKDPEKTAMFMGSNAYAKFYRDLFSNPEKMNDFITRLLPKQESNNKPILTPNHHR